MTTYGISLVGSIRVTQISLGHSKVENAVRYLGVDIEDALTRAEKIATRLLSDASLNSVGVRSLG